MHQRRKRYSIKKIKSIERYTPQKEVQTELEIILETALNSDYLKNDLFVKSDDDDFQQLILLTNGEFDNLIDIQFAEKKVIVISSLHSGSFNVVNDEFVNVQNFTIVGNIALLKFIYNSVIVQVELEKINKDWIHTHTSKDHPQQDLNVKEKLIQIAFDHEKMQSIIERDEKNEFKPFGVLSNDYFSSETNLTFDGREILVLSNQYNRDYNMRISYAKVTKFQIKRKKASFKFTYQDKLFDVNYRKKMKNGFCILSF